MILEPCKPCPFCGSNNIAQPHPLGGDKYDCCSCGATASVIWNTRPAEDALNNRIVELEKERVMGELSEFQRMIAFSNAVGIGVPPSPLQRISQLEAQLSTARAQAEFIATQAESLKIAQNAARVILREVEG